MKRLSQDKHQVTEKPKKIYTQADLDLAKAAAMVDAHESALKVAGIEHDMEAARADIARIIGMIDLFKDIPDSAILIAAHVGPCGHGGVSEIKTAAIGMKYLRQLADAARHLPDIFVVHKNPNWQKKP